MTALLTHKVSIEDFKSERFHTLLASSTSEGKVLWGILNPLSNTTEFQVVQDNQVWAPKYSGSSFQEAIDVYNSLQGY